MGILRKFREWREDKNGTLIGPDIEADSLRTRSLTDTQDGGEWESLREIGYQKGQFYPVTPFGGQESSSQTTNNTYTTVATDVINPRLAWDTIFNDEVQGQAAIEIRYEAGNDQLDIRIQNLTLSETAVEITGLTTSGSGENTTVGPTNYAPSDKTRTSLYAIQIRNADNATAVELIDPTLYFGVEI